MERKEAIEVIKKNWPDSSFTRLREALEILIPELKESEDEKIRKEIVEVFKSLGDGKIPTTINYANIFTYLEKQGKQEKLNAYIDKLASDTIYNDENGNPIDKDLIAFASKVAFSMIPATKTESYHHLNRGRISDAVIKGAQWKKQSEQKPAEHKEIPTDIRSIVDKEANAIWKEINTGHNHSIIDTFNQFYGICMQVAEAVMEYNKPTAWSEEDEKEVAVLEAYIRSKDWSERHVDRALGIVDELVNKVKSLRPQNRWKPSDEQIKTLEFVIESIDNMLRAIGHIDNVTKQRLKEVLEALKKLREE